MTSSPRVFVLLGLGMWAGCEASAPEDGGAGRAEAGLDAVVVGGDGAAVGHDGATDGDGATTGLDDAAAGGDAALDDGAVSESDGGAGPSDAASAGNDGGGLTPVDAGAAGAGCAGYATRYWDCCKAHCGWTANAAPVAAVASCGLDDAPLAGFDTQSSCSGGGAYTCFDMAPWAVSDDLSYGYAAVPANGGICGRCYRLDFDGTGHYDASDPGSRALMGRTMIVQATNIGHDVSGGQFDILIPGGGVGAFNACSRQWGVTDAELGAQYGGFLTACRASGGNHDAVRACVRSRCAAVFDEPQFADLRRGCDWFIDWYQAADNPNLHFREVACPDAIVTRSGVDRRPLNDIAAPMCGGSSTCECDCSWTNGGANCGTDDGSCCWRRCCGGS